MFAIGSDYPNLIPLYTILGDVKSKKFIKAFKRENAEILYGRIKKIFPYGEKFSTDNSEIVPFEEAIYQFRGKLYSFFDNRFSEICMGKAVSKEEIKTPRRCKYRMYIATFYDIFTQELFTKYLVEPL